MSKTELGFCGVDCGTCPIFIATKANDVNKRIDVAKMLFSAYNVKLEPEAVNCTGCVKATMEGTAIMGHCEACILRPCARKKNVSTCAECQDYACAKLKSKWRENPNGGEAEANLNALRNLSEK
jgi:hypothetical protein